MHGDIIKHIFVCGMFETQPGSCRTGIMSGFDSKNCMVGIFKQSMLSTNLHGASFWK